MIGYQPAELGGQCQVAPAGQVSLDPALDGREPGLIEPGYLGAGEGHVGHVGQRVALPQPERLAQRGGGGLRAPPGQIAQGRTGKRRESAGVKLIVLHAEPVAGRRRDQGLRARAKRAPEPGDIDPQRRRAVRRRLA